MRSIKSFDTILWRPIKMRVFHHNESCLSCLHPPSNYEGRREQGRQLSFWWKTLNLIGHYSIFPWRWGWRQLCYPQFWISLLCIVELRWKGAFVSDVMSKFTGQVWILKEQGFHLHCPPPQPFHLLIKRKRSIVDRSSNNGLCFKVCHVCFLLKKKNVV